MRHPSLWRPGSCAAVFALTIVCMGCKNRPRPGDLSDSGFVAAMAELRRAVQPGGAETTRDSAGRQAVRDSILRKYHATAASLESTASHLADRPVHANEILLAIDRKVQALGQAKPAQPATTPAQRTTEPPRR